MFAISKAAEGVILLLAVLLFLVIPSACDCLRSYEFIGIVTDNSLAPLADVEVRLYYRDTAGAYASLGLTNSQGEYRASLETMGAIDGEQINFVKAGYQTIAVEPFNAAEAGRDICDSIILRRDAVLQVQ